VGALAARQARPWHACGLPFVMPGPAAWAWHTSLAAHKGRRYTPVAPVARAPGSDSEQAAGETRPTAASGIVPPLGTAHRAVAQSGLYGAPSGHGWVVATLPWALRQAQGLAWARLFGPFRLRNGPPGCGRPVCMCALTIGGNYLPSPRMRSALPTVIVMAPSVKNSIPWLPPSLTNEDSSEVRTMMVKSPAASFELASVNVPR